MTHKKIIAAITLVGTIGLVHSFAKKADTKEITEVVKNASIQKIDAQIPAFTTSLDPLSEKPLNLLFAESNIPKEDRKTVVVNTITESKDDSTKTEVFYVPFFSQFSDISASEWKKVGCGIASLAMLIEFYEPGATTVDTLLKEGISAGAYIDDAGWSHAGLINLSKKYGLSGTSNDLSGSTMDTAFTKLKNILNDGPVMVSVHYTFDPKNPIPHLVVINGVKDGKVYYNDPAEESGGGSISISQFQSAWKKRYIQIQST